MDPEKLSDIFNINNISKEILTNAYKKVKLIRETELKIAYERQIGTIKGPVHLSIGQEAIATGIAMNLNNKDFIFGGHRSHAHVLALGSPLEKLFAELLGKKTGLSKGMGGSMHLIDKSVGFVGSVPIVAGTIPLAVGAGLAISLKKSNNVAIAFLGDGAAEEGVFHESLNLAKIYNLPVVFVVENNLFSSHMDISLRQPSPFVSRFAEANKIPFKVVDGNNIAEIIESSKELISSARNKKGPVLIEAITYRWLGHVDWREDIDVGINRCKKTLEKWKSKCPLKRFINSLLEYKVYSLDDLKKIDNKIEREIEKAWNIALKEEYSDKKNLLKNVYYE